MKNYEKRWRKNLGYLYIVMCRLSGSRSTAEWGHVEGLGEVVLLLIKFILIAHKESLSESQT